MDNLEKKIENVNPIEQENDSPRKKSLYQSFTDYATDVTAAWIFYTPTYGIIEYFAGMESKEIMKARGMSLVVHAAIGRPVGNLRNILVDKGIVTKESPWYKQIGVNVCSVLPIQAVLYSSMLVASGASKEEIAVALPTGLAIGLGLTEPFGRWRDIWRKMWGKKPAIKTNENT